MPYTFAIMFFLFYNTIYILFMLCLRWLFKFYPLTTSKVMSWWVLTSDSVHLWLLYSSAPLRNHAAQHHELISHSVTLSWQWTNQPLSYPINAEHQARMRQVSIKSLVHSTGNQTPNLPHVRLALYQFGHRIRYMTYLNMYILCML